MTVFELMLYACLTTHASPYGNFGGYSKTCEWRPGGDLFASAEKCEVAAKGYIDAGVMGDTMYVNATNKYEDARCAPRHVTQ